MRLECRSSLSSDKIRAFAINEFAKNISIDRVSKRLGYVDTFGSKYKPLKIV